MSPQVRTTTSADGTTIGWEVLGDGPPMLLVHGSLSDGSTWRQVAEHLRHDHQLHMMDRRGRRLSGAGRSEHRLAREVEDVAAVVAAIGGDVVLCGSSSGAVLCAEAALMTRPSKLVLYEPPLPIIEPIYPAGFVEQWVHLVTTGRRADAVSTFLLMVTGDTAFVASLRARPAVSEALLALADTVLDEIRALDTYPFDADRLASIDASTLVVTGAATLAKWRDPMYALADILPRAHLEVLAGQGHLAMLTDPAGLAGVLHAFLRKDDTMYTLRIEHKISDFASWRAAFDRDPAGRPAAGVVRHRVLRPVDDPQYVMIDLDFPSADEADAFLDRMHVVWGSRRDAPALVGAPNGRVVELVDEQDYPRSSRGSARVGMQS